VDDLSSLDTADLVENWDKTIGIIEQSHRDYKIEKKIESPEVASCIQRPEVVDDFVRNFLRKNGLKRTLDSFQTEWYELKQKGLLENVDIYDVPDAFHSLVILTDEVKKLKTESNNFKNAAKSAKDSYVKVMKERDFHRMHHLRIVQEKNRLITDIKRLKKHYESYEPTLKQLKIKYENLLREKMMVKLEKDRAVAQVTCLQTSILNTQSLTNNNAEKNLSKCGNGNLGSTQKTLKQQRDLHKKNKEVEEKKKKDSSFPEDQGVNPYLALIKGPPAALVRSGGYRINVTIRSHQKSVSNVCLHPHKQLVVTTSDDHLWKLWSLIDGEELMVGQGHTDWVSSCDFNTNGDLLATSSGDSSVKIWDLNKASCIKTLNAHPHVVWDVAWHHTGDFLASASMDQTVKIWDINSERCRGILRGHTDSVNSVLFLPFGNTVLTSSADKTVRMWDARTNICAHTLYGHSNSVNQAIFTMKGDAVISCDSFGSVKMWDVRSLAQMVEYNVGPHSANSITIDSTSHLIAVASDDSSIKMIDVSSNTINNLAGHDGPCNSVQFDLPGSYLVSAGSDCSLRIWN